MGKIFRRREFNSIECLIRAIDCWLSTNEEYRDNGDFLVVIHKKDEKYSY